MLYSFGVMIDANLNCLSRYSKDDQLLIHANLSEIPCLRESGKQSKKPSVCCRHGPRNVTRETEFLLRKNQQAAPFLREDHIDLVDMLFVDHAQPERKSQDGRGLRRSDLELRQGEVSFDFTLIKRSAI